MGQLSLRSGLGKATLSRWEAGAAFPRIPELTRALDALDATPTHRARSLHLLDAPRAILAQRDDARSPLSLGDLLYGLRQRSGKTQADVARATGVSRSLYGQWENDAVQPDTNQIHALGFALGATGEETVALSSRALSQKPAEKSRDALMRLYLENLMWHDGVTEASYTLHLLFLLANFGRLVKQNKADVGDIALVINKYGDCMESWHNDTARRDSYHQRALALAAQAREPLHFHLISAVRSQLLPLKPGPAASQNSLSERVNQAHKWKTRFRSKAGQAYLLMFIAGALAPEAPDEALRMADTYCALVADDPDEYPCRLRDRGKLLHRCGRYTESVAFLSQLVPQDTFRAGIKQLDIAENLAAMNAKAEAQSCLDEGKRILLPFGYGFAQDEITRIQRTLA